MSREMTSPPASVRSLDPMLRALASERRLYVPRALGEAFDLVPYSPDTPAEFNPVRVSSPVKEFLVPMVEPVASLPARDLEGPDMEPFAVLGLKACDLRSIEILDKVFLDRDLEDRFYLERRALMMTICCDCPEPRQYCFCHLMGGGPFPQGQFDLNVAPASGGFVIEAGSQQGKEFMSRHGELFSPASQAAVKEVADARARAGRILREFNPQWADGLPARELLESGYDDEVFEQQGLLCVECQACTRICPTCHCFYLYDGVREEYFLRMKMWDSCIRRTYAQVAGGENPRRMLSDRLRHRMMHKFVYFPDRYGIQMCVGCGRCIEAETGGVDIREIFRSLGKAQQAHRRS